MSTLGKRFLVSQNLRAGAAGAGSGPGHLPRVQLRNHPSGSPRQTLPPGCLQPPQTPAQETPPRNTSHQRAGVHPGGAAGRLPQRAGRGWAAAPPETWRMGRSAGAASRFLLAPRPPPSAPRAPGPWRWPSQAFPRGGAHTGVGVWSSRGKSYLQVKSQKTPKEAGSSVSVPSKADIEIKQRFWRKTGALKWQKVPSSGR